MCSIKVQYLNIARRRNFIRKDRVIDIVTVLLYQDFSSVFSVNFGTTSFHKLESVFINVLSGGFFPISRSPRFLVNKETQPRITSFAIE